MDLFENLQVLGLKPQIYVPLQYCEGNHHCNLFCPLLFLVLSISKANTLLLSAFRITSYTLRLIYFMVCVFFSVSLLP